MQSQLLDVDKYFVTHTTISVVGVAVTVAIICLASKYYEQIRVIDLIVSNWAIKIRENQINKLFRVQKDGMIITELQETKGEFTQIEK